MNVGIKRFEWRTTMTALSASVMAFLTANSSVFAAELTNSTKDTASTIITYLIVATIVVGAIGGIVGILSITSGISWLTQQGQKRLMYSLFGIAGALLFVTVVAFIIKAVTGGGGSFTWSWSF
ncbi:hypothetical protein ESZ50_00500 [Weissella muntiaci]|uniref:Uncharacterized protein n=1 Tax=Weissella muntiaci TaxID=2508881 RepID=A0A6C2CAM1_9LACO|nr:hypothetical protein [Weissella muntiaci]TYC51047.1 hypothetical protein ESZ50_00500 [Weissella muntiaci]